MTRKCLMIAAMLVTSLAACSGGGGTNVTGTGGTGGMGGTGGTVCTPGDGIVCVLATSFNPITTTISKNTSATWQWQQGVHHIVFDAPIADGVGDIGDFSEGTASRAFPAAGSFPFHCTIHGGVGTGMHGIITVQ
jgi:plastocyanin